MEFDQFLKRVLPPLGYAWRPHRRRGIRRKVLERMKALGMARLEDYLQRLESSREEADFFEGLLPVTVSRFFRNHEYFEFLRDQVFPALLQRGKEGKPLKEIKVWSAGAAAGEEPYSIAMIWDSCFAAKFPHTALKILATDLEEEVMARGKRAIYRKSSLKEIPGELTKLYFHKVPGGYRLTPRIKDYVQWLRRDLRSTPPPGPYHIIFCCYLAFTYFGEGAQRGFLETFHDQLLPRGYLFIGKKEKLPPAWINFFVAAHPRLHVFIKKS